MDNIDLTADGPPADDGRVVYRKRFALHAAESALMQLSEQILELTGGGVPAPVVVLTVGEAQMIADLLDGLAAVVPEPDPEQLRRRAYVMSTLLWDRRGT